MARAQDSTDLSAAEEQTSSTATASPSAESPNPAHEEFKVEPNPEGNGGQASPKPLPQDAPALQAPPTLQEIDSPSPEQPQAPAKVEPEPFRRELPKVKLPKADLPVADPGAPHSPPAPPERSSGFAPPPADQPASVASDSGIALSGGPPQQADQPTPSGGFVSRSLPVDVDAKPEAAPADVGAVFPVGPSLPVRSFDVQQALPKPPAAFAIPRLSPKRRSRARGQFTPGFRAGMLRLTVLLCILVGLIGVGWYKHWFPWMHASKKTMVTSWAGGVTTVAPPAAPRTPSPTAALAPASLTQSSDQTAKAPPRNDATASATEGPAAPSAALPNGAAPESVPDVGAAFPGGSKSDQSLHKAKSAPAVSATKRPPAHSMPAHSANPVTSSPQQAVLVPPRLVKSVRAVASLDDLRDFETGSVVIDALVDVSGEVKSMNVISGPPSLRRPALDALKNYKYEPARLGGRPVPAHVTVTMQFHFE